jgi:protoporphyrin/coproporphyrin ferrochelatase
VNDDLATYAPASHGDHDDAGHRYDAVLYLSFGGPESPDDVMPFIRNVTEGRGIPDERLAEVAEHYHLFGGISPINAQIVADIVEEQTPSVDMRLFDPLRFS